MRIAREALQAGRACYSTARVDVGQVVWGARHTARLRRDALALGLGEVDEERALAGLAELAKACFAARSGIVRIQASLAPGGELQLYAEARELGEDSDHWRARTAPFSHRTTSRWTGAKGSNHALYERARSLLAEHDVDEILLADAEGFVVEGCRSNLFVVDREGNLVAPNLSRGAVAGLAQEIIHEQIAQVVIRDVPVRELASVRELIAVNSVRQARPLVALDGQPVGCGLPGSWLARLATVLAEA